MVSEETGSENLKREHQISGIETNPYEILKRANCLVWEATVEADATGKLHWNIRVPMEDAAQAFLPLDVTSGETYTQVWERSKLNEDQKQMDIISHQAITSGLQAYRQTFRCRCRDGSIRWMFEDVQVKNTAPGQWHLVGICSDITDQKDAENALRESEARFRSIFQNVNVGMAIVRCDDLGFAEVNETFCKMLGYNRSEMERLTILDITHETDREESQKAVERVLSGHSESIDQLEKRFVQKDRRTIWGSVSATLVYDDQRQPLYFISVISDITERMQMQQRQEQLARLQALSEMSAGISHNLNNSLTNVLGPAQIIERLTNDERVLQEARDIVRGATQAAELVKRLYAVAGDNLSDDFEPIVLNEVIRDVIRLTRLRWKDEAEAQGVEITLDLQPGEIEPLTGTRVGMQDILVNLIFNAIDAMPEGGTLTIATRMLNNRILLQVKDTGMGMTEDVRLRIFDPFFSTKQDSGSGLGLSTVYNTLIQWGGTVDVESTRNKGTTFFFLFQPWYDEIPATEAPDGHTHQRGRLLIVENDEPTVQMLARYLSILHTVDTAKSGKIALGKFDADLYDVALIDLGLPGMPGDELARTLKELDLNLVTILFTGWFLDHEDPRKTPFDFEIQKPISDLNQLADLIDQALILHKSRRTQK